MDKKELKFYEAPACEVVEVKPVAFLCASTESDVPGIETEEPGGEL